MLCPEVWNFDPLPFSASTKICESEEEIFQTIKHQYFSHFVSITLPNTLQLPNDLISAALDDSQYYRINGIPSVELLKKEFLDLFVNKGQLTAVSITEFSEQDTLVITPCRKFILSLCKTTFQKLGIESNLTKYYKTSVNKYFVVLDLASNLNDLRKKCEQIQKKLAACNDLCFDIILVWEPEDSNVCPSSIALYFSKKGYFVKTCDVLYKHKLRYNVPVPVFDEEADVSELIEWLGAFSLECDLSNDGFISSMRIPEKNEIFGQVMQLNFTGLISHKRLKNIISEINKYMKIKSPLTWISMTVQGFQDSILSTEKKHLFLTDGDNHSTIFFRWNHPSLIYSFQDRKV